MGEIRSPLFLLTSPFRIAKRLRCHSPIEIPVLASTRDALALQSSSARAAWPQVKVCCDLLICRAGTGFKAAACMMVITFSKGERDAEGVLLDLEKRSPRAINSENETRKIKYLGWKVFIWERSLFWVCFQNPAQNIMLKIFLWRLEWGLGLKGILLLHIHIDRVFKRIKDWS